MNLRFWGGWFLAIAGIGILMTMGCEKGALGVKPATVIGQVVDQANPTIPVANAIVRMISKEAVGTSELVQGNNFVSTVTGTDGKFVFESVQADNVVFEYSAPGYGSMIYPKPSSGEAEGEGGTTAEIEFVSIRSGAFVDLRLLPLEKANNPLPAQVTVKIDLVDKTTQQSILFNAVGEHLRFTISLNGKSYTKSAQMWREEGVIIPSSTIVNTVIRNESANSAAASYKALDIFPIDGSGDVFQRVELEPVTYQLSLRCLRVPDYIIGSGAVVNLFAEIPAGIINGVQKPAQIITSKVLAIGDMVILNLPSMSLQSPAGLNLRIQTRGYEDEVVKLNTDTLSSGSQGNYRLDIDMLLNNDEFDEIEGSPNFFTYNVVAKNVVGLYDNMKRRDVRFVVTNLADNDRVDSINISLPHNGLANDTFFPEVAQNGPVVANFLGVAVGYEMSYAMAVTTSSGTFSISKSGLMVNPENEPAPSTLVFAVNWDVEYKKLAK